MVLSEGLHQFLEIKHGLRVSAESLVSSFVSNAGYFKRFGQNIYGLTGTIGNEESQSLLRDIYGIDLGFIPTFKVKQLKEIPMIICNNHEEWLCRVADISVNEAKKGRAVLIINKSIEHVSLIQKKILALKFSKKYIRL